MSHFAKVTDGKVTQVIVAEAEFFKTYVDSTPGEWIQTSYNTRGGKHYDPATGAENTSAATPALRGNYAGIGYTYDRTNDVFYAPQPYPSWVIAAPDWTWKAPVAMPTDGKQYTWDEPTKSWIAVATPAAAAAAPAAAAPAAAAPAAAAPAAAAPAAAAAAAAAPAEAAPAA